MYLVWVIPLLIIEIVSAEVDENCPKDCYCEWLHWKDLPVIQFTELQESKDNSIHYLHTNEAINLEDYGLSGNEENPMVKSITCVLEPNMSLKEFVSRIPVDTESLTLMQASDEGVPLKLQSSDLLGLTSLKVLELKSRDNFKHQLTYILDIPLKDIQYLNLESVVIEGHYNDLQQLMLMKTLNETNDIIVPYELYKEQEKRRKLPIFKGNSNLVLLRLHNCHLSELAFEMFEGLTNLKFLYLDRNEIRIIPPFVFFGVPNLEFLSLAKNYLLDINVSDLSGLLNLEYLDLSYNNFTQLSQLSFPPFPKLNLADFRNNPISIIYSNTFEIMNTTKAIILGNTESYSNTSIQLSSNNAFIGLYQLEVLKIYRINITGLNSFIFNNLINLEELLLTGFIKYIEFDTFSKMVKLRELFLSNCHLESVSMDAFIGLKNLRVLDLSHNFLSVLMLGTFDSLKSVQEIYLNDNKFTQLVPTMFQGISPKLIRLNNNDWNCVCPSSILLNWTPTITNRIKQKLTVSCPECSKGLKTVHKYLYDKRVAPLCATPGLVRNKPVYQTLKRLQCFVIKKKNHKVNLAKKYYQYLNKEQNKINKLIKYQKYKLQKYSQNNLNNNLNNSL